MAYQILHVIFSVCRSCKRVTICTNNHQQYQRVCGQSSAKALPNFSRPQICEGVRPRPLHQRLMKLSLHFFAHIRANDVPQGERENHITFAILDHGLVDLPFDQSGGSTQFMAQAVSRHPFRSCIAYIKYASSEQLNPQCLHTVDGGGKHEA
jgi:hypothetical protein